MNEPLSYIFGDVDIKSKKVFSQIFPDLITQNKSTYYSAYIDYKHKKVYATFRIDFLNECKIQINWIKARQDMSQGIDISVNNTKLKIIDGSNDETKSGFVFMYPTWAGNVTPLLCTPIKFRKQEKQQQKKWLMIGNVWETERLDGRMERNSWGGNHGVVIEQKEKDVYRLHFSCGQTEHPNVTFEDLVIDVAIEGEYHPRFQCSKF